jgi:hypothetical protein
MPPGIVPGEQTVPHGIKQSLVYYENVDVRVIGESAGEIVWAEAEPGLCATDDGNIVRGDRQPASFGAIGNPRAAAETRGLPRKISDPSRSLREAWRARPL